jgi:catechol-2,3-dioxygenase
MRRGYDAGSQEAERLDYPRIHPETRIGYVHLKVANTERSVGFYLDTLGFEVMQWYGEHLDLRDPDDNGVELYWDRPREAWTHDGEGNLAMVTQPLDGAARGA